MLYVTSIFSSSSEIGCTGQTLCLWGKEKKLALQLNGYRIPLLLQQITEQLISKLVDLYFNIFKWHTFTCALLLLLAELREKLWRTQKILWNCLWSSATLQVRNRTNIPDRSHKRKTRSSWCWGYCQLRVSFSQFNSQSRLSFSYYLCLKSIERNTWHFSAYGPFFINHFNGDLLWRLCWWAVTMMDMKICL